VTADEVAEVHARHQAVSDELKKHTPVGRRPLSQVSTSGDVSFHWATQCGLGIMFLSLIVLELLT